MCAICVWSAPTAEPGAARPIQPAGTLPPPGHIFHKNQKLFQTPQRARLVAQVQLDAMAEEGIDVAILYPSRGLNVLSVPELDREFAAALARAYNDWLYEFCQADPTKIVGAGMISPFDIDDAIAETRAVRRAVGLSRDISAREHRQRP